MTGRESGTTRVRWIVLNWNGGDLVLEAVRSLVELDRDGGPGHGAVDVEVVVVDNASTDGSADAVEARFGDAVRVVRNLHNTGFPANNLAMTDLGAVDAVGLLNPDATIDRNALAPLLAALGADPHIGAVSPKMLFETRRVPVELRTTAAPGVAGDPRALGVRIHGLQVDGIDVGLDLIAEKSWPPEGHGDSRWQWLPPEIEMLVPMPAGPDRSVQLQMSANRPKRLRWRSGEVTGEVEIGLQPTTVEVLVGAPEVDVVQNVGSNLYDLGYGGDRGINQVDRGQFDEPTETFAWCGGAVLLDADYLTDVGVFDESFFLYYEDTDLAWRGRLRGWCYRTEPAALVRHVHAASTVEGSPLFVHYVERNRLAMVVKNAPARLVLTALARYVTATGSYALRDVVRPLLARRRPRPRLTWWRIKAFLSLLGMGPGLLRARRTIRARRSVSDAEVLGWMQPLS